MSLATHRQVAADLFNQCVTSFPALPANGDVALLCRQFVDLFAYASRRMLRSLPNLSVMPFVNEHQLPRLMPVIRRLRHGTQRHPLKDFKHCRGVFPASISCGISRQQAAPTVLMYQPMQYWPLH